PFAALVVIVIGLDYHWSRSGAADEELAPPRIRPTANAGSKSITGSSASRGERSTDGQRSSPGTGTTKTAKLDGSTATDASASNKTKSAPSAFLSQINIERVSTWVRGALESAAALRGVSDSVDEIADESPGATAERREGLLIV